MFVIEPATADDLEACAQLGAVILGVSVDELASQLASFVDSPTRHLFVARRAAAVVGYGKVSYFVRPKNATARIAPTGWYLGGLVVAEEERRAGIGTELTAARMAWVAERAPEVWYFTNARNHASLALHAAVGFGEVTRTFEYPGVTFDGGVGVLCSANVAGKPAANSTPGSLEERLAGIEWPRRWVRDLPERVDAAWLDAEFQQLLDHVERRPEDPETWIEAVRWHNEIVSHARTRAQLARLAYRQNTADEDTAAEFARIRREVFPTLVHQDTSFLRKVLASPALDEVRAAFGAAWVDRTEADVALRDPANRELDVRLGHLIAARSRAFAEATFAWRGEQLPITFEAKAALDPDAGTRRAAHESLVATLRSLEPQVQSIFDEACAIRMEMAANAGAASYVDYRYRELGRTDWSPADADVFRRAVLDHVVPIAHDLRLRQASSHGAAAVHPADTDLWPEESPVELVVPVEELPAVVLGMFAELGAGFEESFSMVVDNGLLDLPARAGKDPGANCIPLSDQRLSFIYANHVGIPLDVTVLVHEAGHALQKWHSRHLDLMAQRQPTLEASEIHAMTLELLVHPWTDRVFGDAAGTYATQHVRSQLLAVPYMVAVDAFQHRLYDPAFGAPSTAAARAEAWRDLMDRFQPGIDWHQDPWLHGHSWIRQHHIVTKPFYYLDYALAQVVSWQLWLDSLDDHEVAAERYLELCRLGGSVPFRELLVQAGIGDPFAPGVVADVATRLRPHVLA